MNGDNKRKKYAFFVKFLRFSYCLCTVTLCYAIISIFTSIVIRVDVCICDILRWELYKFSYFISIKENPLPVLFCRKLRKED